MNYTLFDSKKIIFKLFLVELAFKPLVSRLSCKQLGQLFSHFYAVSQNTMKVITRLENVEEFLKNFLSDGKKVDACSFLCTEFGTNKKEKYKKRQRKPQFRAILKKSFLQKMSVSVNILVGCFDKKNPRENYFQIRGGIQNPVKYLRLTY